MTATCRLIDPMRSTGADGATHEVDGPEGREGRDGHIVTVWADECSRDELQAIDLRHSTASTQPGSRRRRFGRSSGLPPVVYTVEGMGDDLVLVT